MGRLTREYLPEQKGFVMARRLATICLVVLFTLGVASRSVSAQDRRNLKGIDSVFVVVETLPNGASKLGLSETIVQTDVEQKLRLAGLRVVTDQEGENLPGSPYLYVRLIATDPPEAAAIEISLNENATLERNGDFAPAVATWEKILVIANPNGQGVRDKIKDLADEFLNAWLAVNPKK
jgi:biotin operon repressor